MCTQVRFCERVATTLLVFVFLIYFMYIVLFITFTFACMTKVLLTFEIHDIFRLAKFNHVTFPALVELPTL